MNNSGHSGNKVMSVIIWSFALIIIVGLCAALFMHGSDLVKFKGMGSSSVVVEYKSIDDFMEKNPEVFVPEFLVNEENVECKTYMAGMTEIYNGRFRYAISKLISTDVKPIGITDGFDIDEFYSLADSEITHVRYQIKGDDTIVSWYTANEMYGLQMLNYDGYNGKEVLLTSLGIDTSKLIEVSEESTKIEVETNTNIDSTEIITVDDLGIEICIPKMEGVQIKTLVESLKSGGDTDRVLFVLSNELLMILEQTSTMSDVADVGMVELDVGGYTLKYLESNPFNSGTIEYAYYIKLVNDISTIRDSFRILD